MMRATVIVATWNVNSVLARMDVVLRWLGEARPDVLCLQELKCAEERFPVAEFARLGYTSAVNGQPTYNGVAILSRQEIEDVRRGMTGDEEGAHARVIAAAVGGVQIAGRRSGLTSTGSSSNGFGVCARTLTKSSGPTTTCCSAATSTSRRKTGTCTTRSCGAERFYSASRSARRLKRSEGGASPTPSACTNRAAASSLGGTTAPVRSD
ncbi:MAG: hypothetical protein DMF66_02390 [Acidobacteria bacterium]|nr:MAG: hypothetical protein DMF66_02390 [Acidobacteriota bacterium]